MEQKDLTRLKHVGPSRMKLLNDHGITTIGQLCEIPEEKLAEIKSIGRNYARLIKISVAEYDGRDQGSLENASALDESKTEKINRALNEKIGQLHETLERSNESLKPLGKKKYLALYIDFKKKSAKLRGRLNEIDPSQQDLPKKVKKGILRKADTLSLLLNQVGRKRKKKRYRKIILEIQSFSKMLRDITSTSETISGGNGERQ